MARNVFKLRGSLLMAKRIINLIISMLVISFDWLWVVMCRLVGLKRRKKCIVLAYHSVTHSQRQRVASQMDVLVRNAVPVGADIDNFPTEGENFASVTFDDGF